MNLLWLTSWYPNKLTPYNGDFIQRHAEAVSLYQNIDVLHVIRDRTGSITKGLEVEKITTRNFTETIIYYYSPIIYFAPLDKLLSYWKYLKIHKKYIRQQLQNNKKWDLVHVHVALKSGSVARWIKKEYAIPYVLTEHWTGYLPEAHQNIKHLSAYQQKELGRIFNEADGISSVSGYLCGQLQKHFAGIKCNIIPNVVNNSVFFPAQKNVGSRYRFIHISGLTGQKNIPALIEAAAHLQKQKLPFFLDIVGPVTDDPIAEIQKKGLNDSVTLHSEMPQVQLAKLMQQSQALILFSKYETFGCVIIEANACGVPVLVSNIPVFDEIVEHGVNGIICSENTAEALAYEMKELVNRQYNFDSKIIAQSAKNKYSYEVVGKLFSDWYKKFV